MDSQNVAIYTNAKPLYSVLLGSDVVLSIVHFEKKIVNVLL